MTLEWQRLQTTAEAAIMRLTGEKWRPITLWCFVHLLGSLLHVYGIFVDHEYLTSEARAPMLRWRVAWLVLTLVVAFSPVLFPEVFRRALDAFVFAAVQFQAALLILLETRTIRPVYYEGLVELFILLMVIEAGTIALALTYATSIALYTNAVSAEVMDVAEYSLYGSAMISFTLSRSVQILRGRMLENRVEEMRRWVESMAHQSKNPWALVSDYAQFLLMAHSRKTLTPDLLERKLNDILETASLAVENQRMLLANAGAVVSRTPFVATPAGEAVSAAVAKSFVLRLYPENKLAAVQIDTTDRIEIAEDLFQNLIDNILKNAITSLRLAGKGEISVRVMKEGARVIIETTDTGIGMDARTRRRVFRRGHGQFPKGTGYGLVFCREVMRLHKGLIQLKSEKGSFTTVRLVFPPAKE